MLALLPDPLPRDDELGLLGTVVGQWHHLMGVPQHGLDGIFPPWGAPLWLGTLPAFPQLSRALK